MFNRVWILIIGLVEVAVTVLWQKKINPETTWIHSIYLIMVLTLYSVYVCSIQEIMQ